MDEETPKQRRLRLERERDRRRRERDPERTRELQRKWRAEHPDRIKTIIAEAQADTIQTATLHNVPWTQEDDETLLGMVDSRQSIKSIAVALGRTFHAVNNRLALLRSQAVESAINS